jgi:CRISPR type III-B/RAMP module RAMP protein Cmr1
MESLTYSFSLLSDTFAHGAYQTMNFNRPELRAPSVKGMVRWWHDALGLSKENADTLFGQAIGATIASRVTLRVHPTGQLRQQNTEFMPHKGPRGGSKTAIQHGTAYQLLLTQRREPLPMVVWSELQRACESWLLLGAIGQRSNRAAGSILWDDAPTTQKEFEIKAADTLSNSKISFAILGQKFENNREAREIAGDFLSDQAFGGTAPFGSARPRKPSPLKLKCIHVDGDIRLLAVWDQRNESTVNLTRGIQTLINGNKQIGRLLEEVLPKLTVNV